MSNDIVEFLQARLDEDASVASTAGGDPYALWAYDGENFGWSGPSGEVYCPDATRTYSRADGSTYHEYWYVTCDSEGITPSVDEQVGPHIARHDPARVLREVEAKRQILAYHCIRDESSYWPRHCYGCGYVGPCDDPVAEDINDCPMLRYLAAVYSDHPDYREDWRDA